MAKTIRIDPEEREELVAGIDTDFPKYTTQILNTANQNSQGTRPRVVGQVSEIAKEFQDEHPDGDFEEWKEFYYEEHDGEEVIEEATAKILDMVEKMREAAEEIDEQMVREWVKDLILYKTPDALVWKEDAILKKLSEEYGVDYRQSTPAEESKGIDGYLGDQPVSIKPDTYKQKSRLQEDIQAPIVYYEEYKTSHALELDVDELEDALE